MTYRIPITVATFAALLLVACGSGSAISTPAPKTPTPRPSATPRPLPAGPFAVAVTNNNRQGVSYQVELIDAAGHILASTTAKLPLLKSNQTVSPPLVSASSDRVYYLDGDTDIHSLSPSGATALVRSIPAGTNGVLSFAVSPDDQRIAVSLIVPAADATKSTGKGYIENLTDSGNHVDLWSNIGPDALRWPVGWHGGDVVDDIMAACGGGSYGSQGPAACSYHVVAPTTGNRVATVCESPAPPATAYYTLNGTPTAAGVACFESESTAQGCSATETYTMTGVDWSGKEHDFLTKTQNMCSGNGLPVSDCFLSTDGDLMACQDNTSQAVTLLRSDGSLHSLGRKYNILGWIDGSHLLVNVDASTLAVVATDTGGLTSISIAHADQVDMATTLPGTL
jgi:hypothetical protein